METLVVLLFPFSPHIAEELWMRLGNSESVMAQPWPRYEPALLVEEEITIAVQVNGKVRSEITVPADLPEEAIKSQALGDLRVEKWIEEKKPRKVIYVKGRLVNIVL
jgi:leucyl-tRNA synthetase